MIISANVLHIKNYIMRVKHKWRINLPSNEK